VHNSSHGVSFETNISSAAGTRKHLSQLVSDYSSIRSLSRCLLARLVGRKMVTASVDMIIIQAGH
jgi:hypothetical protein